MFFFFFLELNWFCMMQGAQKKYPIVVFPFYKRNIDKKARNIVSENDLHTHKVKIVATQRKHLFVKLSFKYCWSVIVTCFWYIYVHILYSGLITTRATIVTVRTKGRYVRSTSATFYLCFVSGCIDLMATCLILTVYFDGVLHERQFHMCRKHMCCILYDNPNLKIHQMPSTLICLQ